MSHERARAPLARLRSLLSLVLLVLPDPSSATAGNDSLVWGAYKPGLYFGVRSKFPTSLTTGLMWARVEDFASVQTSWRWTCEQGDDMAGYGWDEYDARTGGTQTIHDPHNMIDITTEFVKVPGGEHGGGWGARIRGAPREGAPSDLKTTVAYAVNMEGLGALQLQNEPDAMGYEGTVAFQGQTPELGGFLLEITPGPSTNAHPFVQHSAYAEKPLDRSFINSVAVAKEQTWQSKPILYQMMKKQIDMYVERYGEEDLPPPFQAFTIPNGGDPQGSNVHIIQKVFEGAFEFDVLYSSVSSGKQLTSDVLTKAIKANAESFSSRYDKVFKRAAPFDQPKYDRFSKSLFSNLLGGLGYFHGDAVIDPSHDPAYDEDNEGFWTDVAAAKQANPPQLQGPYELFTLIPSRPFFPRGFLWDEGFHLLPVLDWDPQLALEILQSWSRLMDEDGWIAREQILGLEARVKVPQEFQVQYPHIANPPTLFIAFEVLLDMIEASSTSSTDKESYKAAIREIYPLLKRHYFWYRKTQKGDLKTFDRNAFSSKEGYRWRGRTPVHILASGLDDYPRVQPPHPGELHVDLMSWMGMMTRSMKRIAAALGEGDDVAELEGYETAITRNLDDLHWSDADKAYCDATIDDFEEEVKVCHKGYISLFPFMTGMVAPDSPKLKHVLDLIGDEAELWSPHGIRSLSRKNELYGSGENYWRSPVWINMNYLVLTNLLRVAEHKGGAHRAQATRLYSALRKNLVDTVYASWATTGFAWEQYNPETGAGQRTQHFTGWTSLVVKMMCMPDLGGAAAPEHGEL